MGGRFRKSRETCMARAFVKRHNNHGSTITRCQAIIVEYTQRGIRSSSGDPLREMIMAINPKNCTAPKVATHQRTHLFRRFKAVKHQTTSPRAISDIMTKNICRYGLVQNCPGSMSSKRSCGNRSEKRPKNSSTSIAITHLYTSFHKTPRPKLAPCCLCLQFCQFCQTRSCISSFE